MQSQNRLLDDLARVASGAFGVAAGMRSEVESRLREQFEQILSRMDLVTREEYEAAHTMAQNAREQQESMAERMAMLEARVGELEDRLASAQAGGGAGGKAAGSAGTSSSSKGGGKSGKSSSKKSGGGTTGSGSTESGDADNQNDAG